VMQAAASPARIIRTKHGKIKSDFLFNISNEVQSVLETIYVPKLVPGFHHPARGGYPPTPLRP
jgi:hypothetical protein